MTTKTKKTAEKPTEAPQPVLVVHLNGNAFDTTLCSKSSRGSRVVREHQIGDVTCEDCLRIYKAARAARKAREASLKAKRALARQKRSELKEAVRTAKLAIATRLGSPDLAASDAELLAKALATLQAEDSGRDDDDEDEDEDEDDGN